MKRSDEIKFNRIQGENLATMHEVSPEVAIDLGYTTPDEGYERQVIAAKEVARLLARPAQIDPDERKMSMDPAADLDASGIENIRRGVQRVRDQLNE